MSSSWQTAECLYGMGQDRKRRDNTKFGLCSHGLNSRAAKVVLALKIAHPVQCSEASTSGRGVAREAATARLFENVQGRLPEVEAAAAAAAESEPSTAGRVLACKHPDMQY